MGTLPPLNTTAVEYRDRLSAGEFTAVEGTQAYLERLANVDGRTGALIQRFESEAMEAAQEVDRRRASGESPRPLEGVPFTAKGNICTRVGRTTAGSRVLEHFRSPYDATAVRRLIDAGAILVGKTNLDEFAMGSSCENSAFHVTRNPWDLERVPGGSSGGAATLAGALGWGFHLGSDTGGSIRQPASFCGASGMKPSYGRVSRYGLLAFGSSLDQIGPLSRSADDVAAVLEVMAGADPLDSTTRGDEVGDLAGAPAPRTIGVPREYFGSAIEAPVAARVQAAIAELEAAGMAVVEVSLPHTEYANACYQVVATAEASSNLARYDGAHYGFRHDSGDDGDLGTLYRRSRGDGFGAEVRRRILLGTFVLSAGHYDAYYKRALQVRRKIREDFEAAFQKADLLVCPTSPIPPFGVGDKVTDPLALYACDILTVSANLAGIPGISVPCGLDDGGVPVGLQMLGPVGGDAAVLAGARAYQSRTEHHRLLPEGVSDGV